jgi:hypothetical protein
MDLVARTSWGSAGGLSRFACRKDAWVLYRRGIAAMATLGVRSTSSEHEGNRMRSTLARPWEPLP